MPLSSRSIGRLSPGETLVAGRYLLCTANSEPNQCITDGADHHRGHVRTTAPALAEYSESAASRTERSRLGSRIR
jgi:hypothetical protein